MRVLVVADSPSADPCPSDSPRSRPTADLVIAADGGAARCLAAGVEPDIVVGDLDSLDPPLAEELRSQRSGVRHGVLPRRTSATSTSPLDRARDLGGHVARRRRGARRSARSRACRARHARASGRPGARDRGRRELGARARRRTVAPKPMSAGPATFSLMPLLVGRGRDCARMRAGRSRIARLEPISSLGLSNRVPEGSVAHITVHEGVVLLYLPVMVASKVAHGLLFSEQEGIRPTMERAARPASLFLAAASLLAVVWAVVARAWSEASSR